MILVYKNFNNKIENFRKVIVMITRDFINVRSIDIEDIPMAQDFLFKMVKKLYGYDKNPLYHKDIINMKEAYISEKRNNIIGAFDKENKLIGTIAVKRYDDRLESIKGIYDVNKTAELGRCYLKEDLRRKGIGSLLFNKVVEFCKESKYETIYLHTHRHLPGGFDFWKKSGFTIKIEENNEEETIHMEKSI